MALQSQLERCAGLREREDAGDFDFEDPGVDEVCHFCELVATRLHDEKEATRAMPRRLVGCDGRCDGNEHAVVAEHLPGTGDGVAAHRIEDQIDVAQLILETGFVVVDDFIGTEASQVVDVGGGAGGDDVSTVPVSELNSEDADAAGSAVYKDALAGLEIAVGE